VSLHETKRGGEAPTLTNHATSGTKTPGKPSANEDGPKGGPGGEAPWQGVWGVSPKVLKEGASCQPLKPAHERDPKRWRTLS